MEAVGIGLHAHLSVRSGDRIFIGGIFLQAGDESLPLLALADQAVGLGVPLVEIAHHGHALGVGRPDPEKPAVLAAPLGRVSAEPVPAIGHLACMITFRLFFHCHGFAPLPG